jgi:spermidine synthase
MSRLFSFAILLRGAIAVIAQALLVRELLVVFYGNELTFGIILCAWLLCGALGSIATAYLYQRASAPAALFGALQLLSGVWLAAAVILVRSSKILLSVPFGEVLSLGQTVLIAFAALSVSSFCDGAMFSVAFRNVKSVGRIYALECAGALAAGGLFSFVLIRVFTSLQIAFFVWAAAAAVAFGLFLGAQKKGLAVLSFLILCYGATGLIHAGGLQEKTLELQWQGQRLTAYENSAYGNIAVIRKEEQRTVYYDGLPLVNVPAPEDYFTQDFIHLPMLAADRAAASVLFLGNAAGGLLKEAEKYPLKKIVYAETDPLLIGVLRSLGTEPVTSEISDKRLTVELLDGRNYLRKKQDKFDIIFVNTSLPTSLSINRYATKEFFSELAGHLGDNGMAVFKTWGSLSALSRELAAINASLLATAGDVFGHVFVVPGDGYNIFIASKAPVIPDARRMARQMQQLGISASLLEPAYLALRLDPAYRTWFKQAMADAGKNACVNTDLRPCGLYDGLALYYAQFTKKLPRVFGGFRHITPEMTFFAVMLFLFAWSIGAKKPRRRGSLLGFTVFSSGFFAMGVQVSVIFLFQSFLGYIFQWLAVLTASFMAGASLGALYWLRNKEKLISFGRLALVECATGTLVVSLAFFVIRAIEYRLKLPAGSAALFGLISACAGLLVGIELPMIHELLCRRPQGSDQRPARAAGWIYGLDLAGACMGALAAPLLLIPTCGIGLTLLLLWVIKMMNGWIVLTADRNR